MPEIYLKGNTKEIPKQLLEKEIEGYSYIFAGVNVKEHEHFNTDKFRLYRGVISFYLSKEKENDADNYLKILEVEPVIADKQDYSTVIAVALKHLNDSNYLENVIKNYITEQRLKNRELAQDKSFR